MENRIEMVNSESLAVEKHPAFYSDIFRNSEFGDLQVIYVDDKAYFPATECAKILGYVRPTNAVRDHCKGVVKMMTPSNGGIQEKGYIPEGDLYRLIIRSNLPAAEKFEHWVFDDVLPSIRKQGFYSMLTDEKLLEVAYDRCLHNEDHQTLEFQLFKMQDELTIQRWKAMEEVIWPKRFDYMHYEDADREIEDLWGADMEGAMEAKKFYRNNTCSRYGMSRLYGKWKGPKNPLAHRKHMANIDKVIRYEIESARARSSMGLPLNDTHTLLRDKLALEDKIEEIKEIIDRTDKFLAKYDYENRSEPVEDIEEKCRKYELWNTTFDVGHKQLKDYLGMSATGK